MGVASDSRRAIGSSRLEIKKEEEKNNNKERGEQRNGKLSREAWVVHSRMNELISRFRLALKTSTESPLTASISNSIRQEIDSLFIFDFPQDCPLFTEHYVRELQEHRDIFYSSSRVSGWSRLYRIHRLDRESWKEFYDRPFAFVTIECINFES